MGFKNVAVVPYMLDLAGLDASACSGAGMAIGKQYDDGAVNILFVGRVVSNKCHEDLVRVFEYCHSLVNPHSRPLLVGSVTGTAACQARLEAMVEVLDLEDSVHFCGHVALRKGWVPTAGLQMFSSA